MKNVFLTKIAICIMTLAILLLMASCNKEPEPTPTPELPGTGELPPDWEPEPDQNPHVHTYSEDFAASNYTCTKGGTRVWVCSCGDTYSEEVDFGGKHDLRAYEGKSATCTIDGYEGYQKCVRGTCTYSTYKVISALGHDMKATADIAPTCTAPGISNHKVCQRDGCTYETKTEIPALGHIRKQVEGKAATCTEDGYDPYEICTRSGCDGSGLPAPTVINALGHDIAQYEAKVQNCTEFGWDAYEACKRCDYSTYVQIPANGHTYENGYCFCGHNDPGLHEHMWDEGTIARGPDCIVAGIKTYICTDENCGDMKNEEIPALGHDNTAYNANPSTCTSEGWNAYTVCNRCGYSTFAISPMLPHSFVAETVEQPTCALPGTRVFSCDCGKTYSTELAKLGHDWSDWYITKDPTCESSGLQKCVCFNDSAHENISTVPKLQHSWGDWITVESATCTKEGTANSICHNNATHIQRKVIPVTDHNLPNNGKLICLTCNLEVAGRLDTPVVTTSGSNVSWEAVDGAAGYQVMIGSHPMVTTTANSINLEDYYGRGDTLDVKVRAVVPSDASSNTVNSYYASHSFDVPGASIANYRGIGDAVNLLTGSYTDFANGTVRIFDPDKFYRLRVEEGAVIEKELRGDAIITYGENLTEYLNDLNLKTSLKTSTSVSAGVDKLAKITSGYSFEISPSYKRKSQGTTKTAFYDMKYVYRYQTVEVYGYNDISRISKLISDEFKNDAAKVQSGKMTPEQFIKIYGTHIITGGTYGATFDLHYELIGNKSSIDQTFGLDTEAGITNQIQGSVYGVDLGLETSNTMTTNYSYFTSGATAGTQIKFEVTSRGGGATGMMVTSLEAFAPVCKEWADDLSETQDYVLIDVPDGSLYYVWDFLGDEYEGAKDILTNYFFSACDEQYYSLKDKMSSFYSDSFIYDEENNTLTVDLSGLQNVDMADLKEATHTANDQVWLGSNGVITIYPKYNGNEIKKVIFKAGYCTENLSGQLITTKFDNLSIKFDENWKNDIVVEFQNFGYISKNGTALNLCEAASENIEIIITGANYIKCNTENYSGIYGCMGINASGKNLTISGEGELEVIGGYGAKGVGNGSNGYDGAIGVSAKEITITLLGSVNIRGGDGGDGESGKNYGGQDESGYAQCPNGGRGGDGGDGGAPILADTRIYLSESSKLYLQYGDGGDGGKGGDGGDGVWTVAGCKPDTGGNGGDGGEGGYGYNGGNGGKGGNGGDSFANYNWWNEQLGQCGSGGYGGSGNNSVNAVCYQNGTVNIIQGNVGYGGHGGNAGARNPSNDGKYYPHPGRDERSNYASNGIFIDISYNVTWIE